MSNEQYQFTTWFHRIRRNSFLQLRYFPVLTLLPLLTSSVPSSYLPSREIAHYFQALAFARDGLNSYGYLTVRESGAALHLYSLILAPFIKLGFVTSGRFVSAVAALGTTILIAYLARIWFDSNVAFLAPIILWVNPFFYRFAWAYMPDSLSIFLTVSAVGTMVRYTETDAIKWYLVSVAAIVLAIANHGWEATILLPVATLLWVYQKRRGAIIYAILTVASVGTVKYLVGLQPLPTTGSGYLITDVGLSFYFTSDFWMGVVTRPYSPFYLGHSLHFYPGLVAVLYWLRNAYLGVRKDTSLIMAAWLSSGLSIPFILPGGLNHHYYLWALVAPVTLTVAAVIPKIVNSLGVGITSHQESRIKQAATVILIILVSVNGLVFEAGLFIGDAGSPPAVGDRHENPEIMPSEAVSTGEQLAKMDVSDPNRIVFLTEEANELHRQTIFRVLVHGDVLLRDTWNPSFTPSSNTVPRYVTDQDDVLNCDVVIKKVDQKLLVKRCLGNV
ncbi:ArnT family glycosyltransferase [Halorarum halobium]|uniref:ArnT family glycosyltransferase n=1 Tax=Halorarum halobium TaxID=3075121 RepID=UPI0028AD3879|nr:glycosyltransferase family 39 protein [Halobaculum sp. XH14]